MKIQATPSSAQMAHQPDPRRWLMLTVVLCATLIAVLDTFIVNVAIPSIEHLRHGDRKGPPDPALPPSPLLYTRVAACDLSL